jgi:hypothetical protein
MDAITREDGVQRETGRNKNDGLVLPLHAPVIVIIEASEYQRLCGRVGRPGYYDINRRKPRSLCVPADLWLRFHEDMVKASFTLGEFVQALGLTLALLVPLLTASTSRDINGYLPEWVTRALPIYLLILVLMIAVWVRRNSNLLMERRKAAIEELQSDFQTVGYSIEFVREHWDCFSAVTYAIFTPLGNCKALMEADDDDDDDDDELV